MMRSFEAEIKKHPEKDATYIEIPYDVEAEYGTKRVKVVATFDGIEYRGSIVKMGLPCYMLGMTKAIRSKIGKQAGDLVHVTIKKDEEERIVELPVDLKEELHKREEATEFYESLSYSAKRKYCQWIESAKKEETRKKRIEQAVEKLEQHIKL